MLAKLMKQDGPYADLEIMRIINQRKRALELMEEKNKSFETSEISKAMVMENGKTQMIDGEKMKLEYKLLFNNKYFIIAPVLFKNNYKNIPQINELLAPDAEFFTNQNAEINLIVQLIDPEHRKNADETVDEMYKKCIQDIEHNENFIHSIKEPILIEGIKNKSAIYYECYTNLYNNFMYNLVWIEWIHGTIAVAYFSCHKKIKEFWRSAAFGMMMSINENNIQNKNIAIKA